MKKELKFSVEYIQIMDEKSNIDTELMPKPILTDKQIKDIFELMLRTRIFDNKCVKLQRTGRLGTYASSYGEEAAICTTAYLMGKEDWIVPCFREQGAYLARGYPIYKQLLFWAGCEAGFEDTKKYKVLPVCVPVGTQIVHAAGLAWGLRKSKKKSAVICYFGDGATSEGDFHEGFNFASVFKAPVIYLCRNNQWAISTPLKKQTNSRTLAQKGIAYDIKSIKVDGNDVFALAYAMKLALASTKKREPFFIEAETYRLGDHTTSDDEKKYRGREEVRKWLEKEPVARLREYMKKRKLWTKAYEDKIMKKVDKEIEAAIKKEEAYSEKPEAIFQYVFAEPTNTMKKDMERL